MAYILIKPVDVTSPYLGICGIGFIIRGQPVERNLLMIDMIIGKYNSISTMCTRRLLVFAVILVSCLLASLLLSGGAVHASSTRVLFGKSLLYSTTVSNPTATISRYITQVDVTTPTNLSTDGCNQAKAVVGGVAILDFGSTVTQGGVWGTYLPGTTTSFVSNSTIKGLAEKYLGGYWSCDTQPSGTNFILGVGTDNGGSYMTSVANATSAGQEWSTMVFNLKSWISNKGYNTRLKVFGASAMELENNTATITRAWADGFGQLYSTNGVGYIDYGDATGCPTVDSATNQACSNGWTQDDIAYVSWVEQAAYPVPQIYDTAGNDALQWQSIEYYQRSNPNLGYPMYVQGSQSQYEACQQTGNCQGTNNKPGVGWQQLYNALQSSSVTAQSRLWDSTDFQWG